MKIGGTKIYGFGVLIASIFTLFTPPAARASVWALVALRVAEGLSLVSLIYNCKFSLTPLHKLLRLSRLSQSMRIYVHDVTLNGWPK